MIVLLATTNRGKIIEMKEVLGDLGLEIRTPADLGIAESPEEHGDTYEANALEKARFYSAKSNLPTIADDSGIQVRALEKELGIHTRRWGAGKDASDAEWISYFLDRMKQEKNKAAEFVCVLALIDANGAEHLFRGTCTGTITEALEADYLPGLPISACFRPEGSTKVFSALTLEEKNSVSHRGKALLALRSFLEKHAK